MTMTGLRCVRSLGLGCLLAAGALAAVGQVPDATASAMDAAAAQVLAATGVPSASVAVVQGGKIAYVKAYGKARLTPAMDAAPEMQYPIGSISKQFTAAAMLFLVQEGKLTLDDPVAKFLPELTRAKEVTVRQVLSMTSGYQDYWPEDYVMTSMMVPTTPEQILEVWGKKPLDFEPGTEWQYSNTNYVIAGRIVEIVGGKPLVEQLEERIFRPLGMTGVFNSGCEPVACGRSYGVLPACAGAAAACSAGGDGVDVCGGRVGDAGAGSRAVEYQLDESDAAGFGFV